KRIGKAEAVGGMLEIEAEETVLLFCDGANLLYHEKEAERPVKHQLLLEFEDHTAFTASIQMYGGVWCFKKGEFDNPYYLVAKEKPSILSEDFSLEYYKGLLSVKGIEKLSVKAFLATEQRIPGLGNGVLQDILYTAGIHPKRKMSTLSVEERKNIFDSIKSTISEMIELGGRDTEKDLFGRNGGYHTKLSKNTVDKPCPTCGNTIVKEAYLGGSIYYCPGCQVYIK
ncbi:MAG: endonuclease VIII, partial [Mobilitalea sp.]